jgi:adhesin/invasin
VSVSVNGQAAPVFFVSPTQINFQVPWETAVGTASVTVSVVGGASNTVSVPVVSAGPGLFVSGTSAIVQNAADYSLNGPSHPAAAGSTIIAYLTGSGPVSPAATDGVAAPLTSLMYATASHSATIGSAAATVSFAGLAPGWVGLVQANVLVPAGLAAGTYPLTVTIDGQTSNAGSISVQ